MKDSEVHQKLTDVNR